MDKITDGEEMHAFMENLYPICRSITGNGVRNTLAMIKENIPLTIYEIPSGTKVFDWTIPKEWNISDAFIKNPQGLKIVDFKKCNLQVLNYSFPISKKISLSELKEHLFTLPDHPEWIPYHTSYYAENWGFCLPHNQYTQLPGGIYEVAIDSTLTDGHLTYGELHLPGSSQEEVLFSCYVCHPSMCNDNLSGVVLLTWLAKLLLQQKLRYSYRFLFIPETIGAITWLARNEDKVKNIKHGLVATCVGDGGNFTYKKTRTGNAIVDKVVEKILKDSGKSHQIDHFFPTGSDERQFCSPGFNLPIGSLMRTPYGRFPEYHTSADNFQLVKPECLAEALELYQEVVYVLENNFKYINLNPKCEPQLGKRGLYSSIGAKRNSEISQMALLWILNLSDGDHSLLDIACTSGISFREIKKAVDLLEEKALVEKAREEN